MAQELAERVEEIREKAAQARLDRTGPYRPDAPRPDPWASDETRLFAGRVASTDGLPSVPDPDSVEGKAWADRPRRRDLDD